MFPNKETHSKLPIKKQLSLMKKIYEIKSLLTAQFSRKFIFTINEIMIDTVISNNFNWKKEEEKLWILMPKGYQYFHDYFMLSFRKINKSK